MPEFQAHTPLPERSGKTPRTFSKSQARASLIFPALGLLFLSTACTALFPPSSPEELERYPTSPVSTEEAPPQAQEAPERNQEDTQSSPGQSPPGQSSGEKSKKEVKCLAVCKRWGERCATGAEHGVPRCRRVCESFGRDCFEVQ